MEETLAVLVAQNKEILQQLGSVLPRIDNLEAKIMRGEPKQIKQSPSSASAETHVMVEEDDESASHDRAPKPPVTLAIPHPLCWLVLCIRIQITLLAFSKIQILR